MLGRRAIATAHAYSGEVGSQRGGRRPESSCFVDAANDERGRARCSRRSTQGSCLSRQASRSRKTRLCPRLPGAPTGNWRTRALPVASHPLQLRQRVATREMAGSCGAVGACPCCTATLNILAHRAWPVFVNRMHSISAISFQPLAQDKEDTRFHEPDNAPYLSTALNPSHAQLDVVCDPQTRPNLSLARRGPGIRLQSSSSTHYCKSYTRKL